MSVPARETIGLNASITSHSLASTFSISHCEERRSRKSVSEFIVFPCVVTYTFICVLGTLSLRPFFFFFCEGKCLVMLCQHFSLLPYYSYKFFTHTEHAPQNIQSWIWNTWTYPCWCFGLHFVKTLVLFLRRKMFSYVVSTFLPSSRSLISQL